MILAAFTFAPSPCSSNFLHPFLNPISILYTKQNQFTNMKKQKTLRDFANEIVNTNPPPPPSLLKKGISYLTDQAPNKTGLVHVISKGKWCVSCDLIVIPKLNNDIHYKKKQTNYLQISQRNGQTEKTYKLYGSNTKKYPSSVTYVCPNTKKVNTKRSDRFFQNQTSISYQNIKYRNKNQKFISDITNGR